jgi:gamma-glutamylcyclotransferase (GGCT)/AIG2-like uncharacterized protein YtfP
MRVFVYGTLKKGGAHHGLLKDSMYIGTAKIKGTMYSLGPYPAVILAGTTDILGELYEIDAHTLDVLDQLEGYPNYYDRQEIHTSEGDAHVYFQQWNMDFDSMPVVKSGCWPVKEAA